MFAVEEKLFAYEEWCALKLRRGSFRAPLEELPEAVLGQVLGRAEVEPGVELMDQPAERLDRVEPASISPMAEC